MDRAQELNFSSELLRDARGNKQTWDSFFLVIECSAEKQVHIVKQVTGRLAELARSCGAGTTDYLIHYTYVRNQFKSNDYEDKFLLPVGCSFYTGRCLSTRIRPSPNGVPVTSWRLSLALEAFRQSKMK